MKHNIGTRQRGIGGKVSIVEYNKLKSQNAALANELKIAIGLLELKKCDRVILNALEAALKKAEL